MRDELIFSLDIGTRTIIGIVGEYIDEDKFKVLAYSVKEHKKRNMYDGQIHDIEGVTKVVKEIVEELEEKTGEELKVVSIAAAGRALKTHRIKIKKPMDATREISKLDVEALELEAVQKTQEEINNSGDNSKIKYYSIGYSVVEYFLDNNRMEKLEGHKGDEIAVDLLATFLPQIVVESLYSVMAKVGLEVGSITLEPIAAINVAIKQELRLLNLALVDIGAGTSDIAITKEGQIISYAMTSTAGDEITERLSKEYLLDFNSSEKLKIGLSKSEEHEFADIVGINHKLTTKEIVNSIIDIIEKIGNEIAEKILEFNGKSPNAVFLIGGSSQMPMLKETIADKLGLPRERVAIRELSVIENIIGLEGFGEGPDMITPIGIALEGSEDKYRNFIKVYFNEEQIPIFNTEDIKVSDVLVMVGYEPKNLLPKRAEDFVYYINGKKRLIKGDLGSYPQIIVDGETGSLKTKLENKSVIDIIPSTVKPTQAPSLYDIIDAEEYINYNNKKIKLIKSIRVNGREISENIFLDNESYIELLQIKTIEDFLDEYNMELDYNNIRINGKIVNPNYILRRNDNITILEENVDINKNTDKREKNIINLLINGEVKTISHNKDKFVFVDIFDYIDFDLSRLKGKLVLKTNGKDAEYMEELKDGDNITINWE